jgi:hypothetical protein
MTSSPSCFVILEEAGRFLDLERVSEPHSPLTANRRIDFPVVTTRRRSGRRRDRHPSDDHQRGAGAGADDTQTP